MGTIGQDAFTAGSDENLESHTPDVGAGWSVEVATKFQVRGSTDDVDHTASAIEHARKGDDIGDDDMDVTGVCKCANASARIAGVTGRVASGSFNNCYEAYLNGDGSAVDVFLFKNIAGTRTQLGTWNGNLTNNTEYTVKLEIRTAAKKVYVNGTERISSSDDSLTGNNYAGIVMNGSAGGNSQTRVTSFLSESIVQIYALNAEAGSYAVSGSALTPLAHRLLVLDPGSYALSGATAILIGPAAYVLNAQPGSYALSGANASLLARRVVQLNPGVYTLTGASLTTLAYRLLVLAPGAYVLSGTAAILQVPEPEPARADLKFFVTNLIDGSTVILTSNVTNQKPLVNLQHVSKGKVWRGAGTSAIITIDLGSAKAVDALLLTRENFTADATIEWRYSSDNFSSEDVQAGLLTVGAKPRGFDLVFPLLLDAPVSRRYWRLIINDASNPDGYLQIGRLYIGPRTDFTAGLAHPLKFRLVDSSLSERNAAGDPLRYKRAKWRRTSFSLSPFTDAVEAHKTFWDLVMKVGLSTDFFIGLSPQASAAVQRRHTLYGSFAQVDGLAEESRGLFIPRQVVFEES